MNVTFYTDNVDPRIPEMQKKVFGMFGIPLHQIKPRNWEGHGGTIDGWLEVVSLMQSMRDEVIILWDIDCIPLQKDIVNKAEIFARNGGIIGVAQKASHIPNSIVYAGPAFLAFSMKTYKALGSPTFTCTDRSDCGGELTYKAIESGLEMILLRPTHVEKPMWDLTENTKFGPGTTFDNVIYHAFYSRKNNGDMFIKKCEEVIANNSK